MHHDRKCTLNELKQAKSCEEKSVIFMRSDKNNFILVSYIDKKKSGKKILSF